ncbi:MAG: sigma-70 family RNA polymerase sigma factor [Solirubrobacterales bacterium]|nr:sigma-70 family RNA polymerase sigma factor [Solirubrobacterales bacterium]
MPFAAWIIRVARNVAVDYQRDRRSIPCEEVFAPSQPTNEAAPERRWGLEQALEALPDDQRDVVVLRHVVGLSPTEIANRMGRTEASVHGLHHRGRENLRRELEHVSACRRLAPPRDGAPGLMLRRACQRLPNPRAPRARSRCSITRSTSP